MKLRYYLRGLGIGILVTAIIMSFVRKPEKLTDAQIKLRAFELGMVEKNVLADLQEEEERSFEKEEENNVLIQEEMAALDKQENITNENFGVSEETGNIIGENSGVSEETGNIVSENSEAGKENIVVSKEDSI